VTSKAGQISRIVNISALNRTVFSGNYEADLIDNLRSAGLIITSLVASDGDEVIGHILFSQLSVEIDGKYRGRFTRTDGGEA